MAFSAVLDACVLYPFSLRDTLLRLAEQELYVVRWSDRILEEMRRNLVAKRLTEDQAAHLLEAMLVYFPEASVSSEAVTTLEPAMENDEKDRHVLATAVACNADAVVTFNLRHFQESACLRYGISPIHPDEFLLALSRIPSQRVQRVVLDQAIDLSNPSTTVVELLAMLKAAGVPRFVSVVEKGLGVCSGVASPIA